MLILVMENKLQFEKVNVKNIAEKNSRANIGSIYCFMTFNRLMHNLLE